MNGPTLGDILGAALADGADDCPPIYAAAEGDPVALRQMADEAYSYAGNCEGLTRLCALIEALSFARLVAVATDEGADALNVIYLNSEIAAQCRLMGDHVTANSYEATALHLAEMRAEDGDDALADNLAGCAHLIPPEVFLAVRQMREGVPDDAAPYRCDRWQYRAARQLAADLAPRLNVGEAEVYDAICSVPDPMLDLLKSPDGWAALASFVAADFGCALNNYSPTLN